MKRITITAIAVFILSLTCTSVHAQKVEPNEKAIKGKTEYVKKKQPRIREKKTLSRDQGIFIRPELGIGLFTRSVGDSYRIRFNTEAFGFMGGLTVGFQFNNFISAGVSVDYLGALGRYRYSYYNLNNDDQFTTTTQFYDKVLASLPVKLNARICVNDDPTQFFIDLRLGFMIPLQATSVSTSRSYFRTGESYTHDGGYYVMDRWYQYDNVARMAGITEGISIGLMNQNGWAFSIGVDAVTWKYKSTKSEVGQLRPNGRPQWEYDKIMEEVGANYSNQIMESDSYTQTWAMPYFKIDYTIPFKKK